MLKPETLTLKDYAEREGNASLYFWQHELRKASYSAEGLEPKLGCEDRFVELQSNVNELMIAKELGFEHDRLYQAKHRWYVAFALRSGKTVSPEVLADYPDLHLFVAKQAIQACKQHQIDWLEHGVDRVYHASASLNKTTVNHIAIAPTLPES